MISFCGMTPCGIVLCPTDYGGTSYCRWSWFEARSKMCSAERQAKLRGENKVSPPPNATTCRLVEFVVLPPGHGRSVTDFSGWDAHEAQLRCPDGVWVVIEEDVVPGGALNLNSTNLPRPWSPRKSSPSREIPTVEPGIERGASWLVVRDSEP